ncbi:MAG: tetratricopeptide repeat protein [Myxococcota bacterium]
MMRRAAMTLLLLAAALTAGPARADGGDKAEAVEIFERGEAQFAAGHYDAAADLFLDAWDLHPDPAYLFNIALSYEKQERWSLAARYYRRFLDEAPGSPAAPEVRRRLEAAERGREAALVTVEVRTEPPGAEARLLSDPEAGSCRTPCELRTGPGATTLEVSLDDRGFRRARSLDPGARWVVDEPLGDAGPLAPLEGPDRTWSWVSWGVGAAALVNGAVLGGLALRDYGDGEDLADRPSLTPDERDELGRLRDRVDRRSLAADVSFGVAAAGAIVGTVLWFTADDPEPEPPVALDGRRTRWTVWRF